MKNIKLLTSTLLVTLACPLLGSFLNQVETKSVFAEGEAKDMSGIHEWKAIDGNFVSIDDWYYSAKGFSFEFKLKNPSAANVHETLIVLTSNGVELTDYKDLATGGQRAHNFNTGTYDAHLGVNIPLGDDWYRYELMLPDITGFIKTGANKHATVDGLKWIWNYYNDLEMKNMKIINSYSPEGYTHVDNGSNFMMKAKTPKNDTQLYGGVSDVLDFYNSGKGFSVEFEDGKAKHEIVYNLGGIEGTLTNNSRMFRNGGVLSAGEPGRITSLGNNWYRFELMFKDSLVKTDALKTATFNSVNFIWVPDGYGATKYRNFKIIDGYSCKVNLVNGATSNEVTVNGKLVEPEKPTAPNGKHFDGWYKEDTFTNKWDFDDVVESDMSLYAKFVDHSFAEYCFDDNQHWTKCSCGATTSKVGHAFTEENVDNKFKVANASCSHGTIYYKSCVCGKAGTETFEVGEGDPNVHDYGELVFEIDVQATCESDGHYIYHSDCKDCGNIDPSTKVEGTISKTGHSFEVANYTLNETKTSGTITLVCKYDSNHTQTIAATVTKQTIAAQVGVDGVNVYTLVGTHEGKTYTKVVEEIIPAIIPSTNTETDGGCQGSIITSSILVSLISLTGVSLLLNKKSKED